MVLNISLSPAIVARLEQLAMAEGSDLASIVVQAVEEKLDAAEEVATADQNKLSADAWIAQLRAWASSHRRLPFEADDSRERIYEGRGE
ncbi:MAG TPA: hypothetical protein P5572_05680 [Phycisphaerae bacterium]|nr:hypothetical protein [Phycisphaerae bacterium]